jgi:hypothetical protein
MLRTKTPRDESFRSNLSVLIRTAPARERSASHIGRVLEMAESSPSKYDYEKKVVDRFGGQQELELVTPSPGPEIDRDDLIARFFLWLYAAISGPKVLLS